MGVLFAGFLRVPMTSVFMVLEVSGNYEIIVPVIVANTFSYLVSRSLQTIPIFDLLTRQDGLILPSLEEDREETILRVEDAMLPVPATILSAQDYVDANFRRVQNSTESRLPGPHASQRLEYHYPRPTPAPLSGRQRRTNAGVRASQPSLSPVCIRIFRSIPRCAT